MDAITGFVDEYLSTFDPRDIIKPQGWNKDFFGVPNFNRKVMYSEGQYQVECLDWPPHAIIPEHRHPDIDSYEVYIRGKISFSHGGYWIDNHPEQERYAKCDTIFLPFVFTMMIYMVRSWVMVDPYSCQYSIGRTVSNLVQ